MYIVTIVLSALLGLAFLGAGSGKLRLAEPVHSILNRLEVSHNLQKVIGALEVLGGIGVVAGIWFQPLGIAAAVGLLVTMLLAVGAHVRKRETFKDMSGAVMLGVLSALVLVLQIAFTL